MSDSHIFAFAVCEGEWLWWFQKWPICHKRSVCKWDDASWWSVSLARSIYWRK